MLDIIKNSEITKQNEYSKLSLIKINIIIYFILIKITFVSPKFTFVEFTSQHYRAGSFAFNKNKDMIIEYSYKNYRLFFGLKQNGKCYFKDNEKETYIREKYIEYIDGGRYEVKNIFVSLKNDTNIQYLFNTGYFSITEIHNLITNETKTMKTKNYFNDEIYTYKCPMLALDDTNEYFIIYLSDSTKYCIIKKLLFSDFELNNKQINMTTKILTNKKHFTVGGFLMNKKIVVFYLNNSEYYCINIYNSSNLDIIVDNINIEKGVCYSYNGIFFKGLHLKNELMAFIYYKKMNGNSLELKIGYTNIEKKIFNASFTQNFENNNFFYTLLLNDFIKVDDERLAFIGVKYKDLFHFIILLFDLYDNYNFMKIRKYYID